MVVELRLLVIAEQRFFFAGNDIARNLKPNFHLPQLFNIATHRIIDRETKVERSKQQSRAASLCVTHDGKMIWQDAFFNSSSKIMFL